MRRVMMFMPLIFVLVVIRFPAGVLVYWITTNTWTIGQQYIVKRRMGPMQAATAGPPRPAAAARGPPTADRCAATAAGRRRQARRGRPAKAPPASPAAEAGGGSRQGRHGGERVGRRWAGRDDPQQGAAGREAGDGGHGPAHRASAQAAAQEEEALGSPAVGVRVLWNRPGGRPGPRADGADRRRGRRRGRRRDPRRRGGPDGRVRRRGPRAADRPSRADDRRDPASRLPVRDARRGRARCR